MSTKHNKFNLEERLINFSVLIIQTVDQLPKNRAGNHLGGQLIRSGTSPALNYGEAQAAESKKDFLHKIKVTLKELRETQVCLKIIQKAKLLDVNNLIQETSELVAIFVKSVQTAQQNQQAQRKKQNY